MAPLNRSPFQSNNVDDLLLIDGRRTLTPEARKKLGWILAIVFAIALLMGPGPGLLLINQPKALFGLPALYVWGLIWFVVEVGVVVLLYLFVWSKDEV